MKLILGIFSVICLGLVTANENDYLRDAVESRNKGDEEDQDAYESFAAPVYGPNGPVKSGGLPANAKSGYPLPASAVPGGYSGFLGGLYGSLGYGYGAAPFGRYGFSPYSSPYFGYGSPYNGFAYGYGPGLAAGLGYGSGLAYGSPALTRGTYTIYGNGYPGYAGLGYRYGALGYNSGLLRAPGVPAPVPASYSGFPGAVPAAYANAAVPLPATYGLPPQVPAAPGTVPLPAAPYRPPVVATQGKDGALRYAYVPPTGQRLPLK